MSKVATWVQGNDGKYYKNPIIEKEGFFVCFDDDEEPEIVVAVQLDDIRSNTGQKTAGRAAYYRQAADLLKSLKIPYRIKRYGQTCTRLFGEYSFKPAFSVYFTLTGPLPVECITKFDKVASSPQGECTFYHFTGAFPL